MSVQSDATDVSLFAAESRCHLHRSERRHEFKLVFCRNGDDALHIRHTAEREHLRALTKELLEPARRRQHPMFTRRRSAILESMSHTARRISDPAGSNGFGPTILPEVAKTSFQHDKQFIFAMMNMRRRPMPGRSCAKAEKKRTSGFFAAQLHLHGIAECFENFPLTRP